MIITLPWENDVVYSHVDGRCEARFIPAHQLDELVWQDLCSLMTHPEIIAAALQRAQGGGWLPKNCRLDRKICTVDKSTCKISWIGSLRLI